MEVAHVGDVMFESGELFHGVGEVAGWKNCGKGGIGWAWRGLPLFKL